MPALFLSLITTMTISRMQQPRQLYGLGSLVKKITKPIKKIVKSPIGKAALGAAALYGLIGLVLVLEDLKERIYC